MKRTAIAVVWIIGTTVPLAAAVVFIFGCCILPFHGLLHKALPICHVAVDFISGEHDAQHEHQTPVPPTQKQEPVKRIATDMPRSLHVAAASLTGRRIAASDATTYRSYIALGAMRCDADVGLHLLVATLLI